MALSTGTPLDHILGVGRGLVVASGSDSLGWQCCAETHVGIFFFLLTFSVLHRAQPNIGTASFHSQETWCGRVWVLLFAQWKWLFSECSQMGGSDLSLPPCSGPELRSCLQSAAVPGKASSEVPGSRDTPRARPAALLTLQVTWAAVCTGRGGQSPECKSQHPSSEAGMGCGPRPGTQPL